MKAIKEIGILVPFQGCKTCERFKMHISTLIRDDFYDETVEELYTCEHSEFCEYGYKVGKQSEEIERNQY